MQSTHATTVRKHVVSATDTRPPNDEPREMLTWLSLACAGMAVVMHLVIPSMMVSTARRGMLEQSMQARGGKASEVISWFAVYQVRTIMAVAILEGAGFFLSIAHLMEGRPESAGAAVVILALILIRLPTAPRVAEWIETQMRHA